MNLYGKKVVLRAMEPEDMEMLRGSLNDPAIERMVGGWSFPVSTYEQMKWYERVVGDQRNVRMIIEDKETGEAVGMISLTNIDWKNRDAEYAIKLKPDAPRKRGYGADSEFTLMRYVFEELQLHRLTGEVLAYNEASIAMTEKCGAKREGLKRQAVYKNGQYHDVICYGVLYEDFLEAAQKAGWLDE